MTRAEQARQVAWRDKLLQFAAAADRSVSYACRHFGISRKTFYKWKARHEYRPATRVRPECLPGARSPACAVLL